MKILTGTFGLLLLLISSNSFSQKKESITVSIGASQPLGSFGKTSVGTSSNPDGYASTGIYANIVFKKQIRQSPLSVAGMLEGNVNFLKTGSIINNYKVNNPGFNFEKKSSGSWTSVALMPGLCYTAPGNGKLTFTAGIFAGAAWAHLPGFVIEGKSTSPLSGDQLRSEQQNKSAIAFNGKLNAGVQFKAGKNAILAVTAGYNYLKPTFKDVVSIAYSVMSAPPTYIAQYTSSRWQQDYKQSMHTLSLGIGMVWVL